MIGLYAGRLTDILLKELQLEHVECIQEREYLKVVIVDTTELDEERIGLLDMLYPSTQKHVLTTKGEESFPPQWKVQQVPQITLGIIQRAGGL